MLCCGCGYPPPVENRCWSVKERCRGPDEGLEKAEDGDRGRGVQTGDVIEIARDPEILEMRWQGEVVNNDVQKWSCTASAWR